MAESRIAAIIVSYNTRDLLLKSVASAVESAAAVDVSLELVVVDNASADGSVWAVKGSFPRARVLANRTNAGFGAACNQGIEITTAPLILLLNSDAQITPEALRALLECMKSVDRCGAAGCRIVDEQGNAAVSARRFLTPFNQALETLGVTKVLPAAALRRTHALRLDARLRDCSPDWIDGACLLLKRAALDEIGRFDERFFMYSEDEDLCFRLRQAGWRICYCGAGAALHQGGASAALHGPDMVVQFYISQMLFLTKHRGQGAAWSFARFMSSTLAVKRLLARFGLGSGSPEDLEKKRAAFSRARQLWLSFSQGQQR